MKVDPRGDMMNMPEASTEVSQDLKLRRPARVFDLCKLAAFQGSDGDA
jgi:hypothetical protein